MRLGLTYTISNPPNNPVRYTVSSSYRWKTCSEVKEFSPASFPWWLSGKKSTCQCLPRQEITGSTHSSIGNGNPLQHSCLENSTDRGTWQATVHGVAKESDTTYRLNNNKLLNITLYLHSERFIYLATFRLYKVTSVMSNSLRPHGLPMDLQAPLSMGFSRQEHRSRWPFLPPGDSPSLGTEPKSLMSPHWQVTTSTTWEAQVSSSLNTP